MKKNFINAALPWRWLYSSFVTIASAIVGGSLLYLGVLSLIHPYLLPVIYTTNLVLFVNGIIFSIFVVFWTLHAVICLQSNFRKSTPLRQSTVKSKMDLKVAKTEDVSDFCGCISCLGIVNLLLVFVSLMSLLVSTAMLWRARYHLELDYEVRGSCFCTMNNSTTNTVNDRKKICEEFGDHCNVIYYPKQVFHEGAYLTTVQCQNVDLGTEIDVACLQYVNFWNWFRVLRIILPFLMLLKIPIIVVDCSSWVQGQQKNKRNIRHNRDFASDSVSWSGLVEMPHITLVDPVRYYADMCLPRDERPATLGKEQNFVKKEPFVEPQEKAVQIEALNVSTLPFKPATLRSSAMIARSLRTQESSSTNFLTAVPCPIAPREELPNISIGYSSSTYSTPLGSYANIISTPERQPRLSISTPLGPPLNPNFDISKVVSSNHLKDPGWQDDRSSILSSFNYSDSESRLGDHFVPLQLKGNDSCVHRPSITPQISSRTPIVSEDLKEISRRAIVRSSGSNVDWSRLP